MAFRFLKRKTRVWFLVFCIIVVLGAFAWEKYNIGELSIERLKSMLSDLELLRATVTTEIELSEDLGVDLSEMDLEDIFAEQGLGLNEEEVFPEAEETIVLEKQMSLEEIKEKVDIIAEKVDYLEREVDEYEGLVKMQTKINEITRQIQKLTRESKKLG